MHVIGQDADRQNLPAAILRRLLELVKHYTSLFDDKTNCWTRHLIGRVVEQSGMVGVKWLPDLIMPLADSIGIRDIADEAAPISRQSGAVTCKGEKPITIHCQVHGNSLRRRAAWREPAGAESRAPASRVA